MGLGDFPDGESLGIPPDVQQQAKLWQPRRSIFDALLKASGVDSQGGGQSDPGTPPAQPRLSSGVPADYGISEDWSSGGPHYGRMDTSGRLVDRINDDPREPLHSGMISGVQDTPTSQTNQTPYGPQPTHMTELEDEYQRLGQPTPQQPQSLKHKIMSGLLTMVTPPAIRQQQARQQEQKNFEQAQNNAQRGRLLTDIEAERRLQEWADMAQPEHMDTEQGPIQFNRQTKQWEPISIGGQRVGPKAQPKPDTPEQQFFDSPEESGKPLSQRIKDYADLTKQPNQRPDTPEQQFFDSPEEAGKTLAQKLEDYKRHTESPQHDPQQLAIDPQGHVINLRPGMTVPPGTTSFSGMVKNDQNEQGKQTAQNYAADYVQNGTYKDATTGKPTYTGPGDEALMEKFFEMAKPSSGFRMTQSQQDMLKNAQSWKNSITARYRHATSGTWFSDEQRQQIAGVMAQIGRDSGGGQSRGAAPQGAPKPTSGAKLKDRVSGQVLVEGKDF